MKQTLGFADRQIIDAGVAFPHQAIIFKLPIFIAVRAKPLPGVIFPFIGEANRNAMTIVCPNFFDQSVFVFALPFSL